MFTKIRPFAIKNFSHIQELTHLTYEIHELWSTELAAKDEIALILRTIPLLHRQSEGVDGWNLATLSQNLNQ